MSVFHIIYTSHPFGFDESTLGGILVNARQANARSGITGALICRRDIYMQWLEGPEQQVKNTMERIARDRRHIEVKVHVAGLIPQRIFGEWSMLHDPARSWIWTHEEVAGGAAEHSTPEKVVDFFMKTRAALQI